MTHVAKEAKPSFEHAIYRVSNQPKVPWARLPITAMLNANPSCGLPIIFAETLNNH